MMSYVLIDVKRLVAEAEKMSRAERSYWSRGVASLIRDYAEKVLSEHDGEIISARDFYKLWNCGADSLRDAVYGGSFDIWNYDIAKRLCTPSKLKKSNEGMRSPNKRENWLDVEIRAMYQAMYKSFAIMKAVSEYKGA